MGSGRRPVIAAIVAVFGLLPCGPALGDAVSWVDRAQARSLSMPYDIATDRKGVIFLLESGSRTISIFSPKGEFLREIPGRGVWKDPSAIAVGAGGTVYIADGNSGRVLELDLAGKVRKEFVAGDGARLTGVGVFGDDVYCVDNRNHRVLVFRKRGAPPEKWGKRGDGPGDFQSPFRLAIDPSGRVFVTDVLNARIQWFSAFGQHLGTLKRFGAGEGKIFRPTGLAIDGMGKIWVGDSYTGLVQRFDASGGFSTVLRTAGRPHVFGDPVALAVIPGGVWVADQRENRLGRFPGE
jgi:DNA-binding beta-propeller fold protein YncE